MNSLPRKMTKSSVSMATNASHTLDSPCGAMLMAYVSACAAREGDQSPPELLSNTRQPRCWIRSRGLLISTSHAGMGRIEGREHSSTCCQTVHMVQRSSLHGLCMNVMLYARAMHAMSTRNRFIHLQRHTNLNALPRQRQRRGRSDHRQDKPRLSGYAAKHRGGDPEASTSLHSILVSVCVWGVNFVSVPRADARKPAAAAAAARA